MIFVYLDYFTGVGLGYFVTVVPYYVLLQYYDLLHIIITIYTHSIL